MRVNRSIIIVWVNHSNLDLDGGDIKKKKREKRRGFLNLSNLRGASGSYHFAISCLKVGDIYRQSILLRNIEAIEKKYRQNGEHH